MEFGHTTDLTGIDFSLPPDDPRSDAVLAAAPKGEARVFSGGTGWTMREWAGRVYPQSASPQSYLFHYARQFNGIELNATHYALPDSDLVARWKEQTPEGFRFSPKFPQSVSHAPDLRQVTEQASRFAERMLELGDRLGCAFLQLPPTTGPEAAADLAQLLDALPRRFRVAVEFRHPRWFQDHRLVDEAFEVLAPRGVATVITDVAGRRDVLHTSLTAPIAMLRFVGHGLHPTDYERLDAWSERFAHWIDRGLRTAYVFHHQRGALLSPESSNAFVERMNRAAGRTLLRPWKPAAGQMALL